MGSQYIHIIINLLAVLALMVLILYLLKKFKISQTRGNQQIKILNMVAIGTKEKVILMEVNKVLLLIGATPTHIETLHNFSEKESTQEAIHENKNFADTLVELNRK